LSGWRSPWRQPVPAIPKQAPKLTVFAGSDGRMWMHCWYHPLEAAAEADRLARLGFRMWVFEAEERPVEPGELCRFDLWLQGAFGSPEGSAAAAVVAIARSYNRMSFTLQAK
jgi:hypothetical protein